MPENTQPQQEVQIKHLFRAQYNRATALAFAQAGFDMVNDPDTLGQLVAGSFFFVKVGEPQEVPANVLPFKKPGDAVGPQADPPGDGPVAQG